MSRRKGHCPRRGVEADLLPRRLAVRVATAQQPRATWPFPRSTKRWYSGPTAVQHPRIHSTGPTLWGHTEQRPCAGPWGPIHGQTTVQHSGLPVVRVAFRPGAFRPDASRRDTAGPRDARRVSCCTGLQPWSFSPELRPRFCPSAGAVRPSAADVGIAEGRDFW